jgi:transposase
MGRKTLQLLNHKVEEIDNLIEKNSEYKTGIKLYAIRKIYEGKSSRVLSDFYNVSFKQITNWAHSFDKYGLDGLIEKKKRGKLSRLTNEQMIEIKDVIVNKDPTLFGYTTGTWTGLLIIDWIKKKFGIEYKKAQIYNILKKIGLTYQKGRGIYPERNEEERLQFIESIKKNSN